MMIIIKKLVLTIFLISTSLLGEFRETKVIYTTKGFTKNRILINKGVSKSNFLLDLLKDKGITKDDISELQLDITGLQWQDEQCNSQESCNTGLTLPESRIESGIVHISKNNLLDTTTGIYKKYMVTLIRNKSNRENFFYKAFPVWPCAYFKNICEQ